MIARLLGWGALLCMPLLAGFPPEAGWCAPGGVDRVFREWGIPSSIGDPVPLFDQLLRGSGWEDRAGFDDLLSSSSLVFAGGFMQREDREREHLVLFLSTAARSLVGIFRPDPYGGFTLAQEMGFGPLQQVRKFSLVREESGDLWVEGRGVGPDAGGTWVRILSLHGGAFRPVLEWKVEGSREERPGSGVYLVERVEVELLGKRFPKEITLRRVVERLASGWGSLGEVSRTNTRYTFSTGEMAYLPGR